MELGKVANGVGNEANMERVKNLMEQAKAVNLGDALTEGVDIDYTTTFGINYKGTVVFKRPNMQDYMKMGSRKAQILGQNGSVDLNLVDGMIKYLAHVMSNLSVVVVKAPEWMIRNDSISVEHFEDPDILYHIFEKYEEWESTFRKPVPSELQGDSKTTE